MVYFIRAVRGDEEWQTSHEMMLLETGRERQGERERERARERERERERHIRCSFRHIVCIVNEILPVMRRYSGVQFAAKLR